MAKKNILSYAIILGYYLIIYSPSWLIPYAMMDSYSEFNISMQHNTTYFNLMSIAEGRSIYALIIDISFSLIHSFTDIRFIRLVGVICVSLLMIIIYRHLVKNKVSDKIALIIVLLIGTLPPFQVYASWANTFPNTIAAIVSYFSYLFLIEKKKSVINYSLSIIFEVVALSVYQPAAMYILFFVLIYLFMGNGKNERKFLIYIKTLLFFFLDLLIYFIIEQISMHFTIHISRTSLVNNLFTKATWFIKQPLLDSTNLWNLNASAYVSIIIIAMILLGMYFYSNRNIKLYAINILTLGAITILSYFPNLVVSEDWASYRTQSALMSVIFIIIIISFKELINLSWILKYKSKLTLIFVMMPIILGLLSTYEVLYGFALPQLSEIEDFYSQININKLPTTKTIYMVPISWRDPLSVINYYDEYGSPSTGPSWNQGAFVYALLNNISTNYSNIKLVVINGSDINKFKTNKYTQLVDMRRGLSTNYIYK